VVRVFRVSVQRRFSDLDLLGHVNNIVYHDYLQEGRIGLFTGLGPFQAMDASQVLARQEIDFRKPLLYRSEPITVETWVTKVGRSSYTIGYRILDDDGSLAADAVGVMVCFDAQTGRAHPIPDEYRRALVEAMEDSTA
jgi:acyl-CoA thioester hydrolase